MWLYTETALVIVLAIIIGLVLSKKLLTPKTLVTPQTQIVEKIVYTSGDPVTDFLDNYGK